MAKNVFISFRYSDGHIYKEQLCNLFNGYKDTVDYSEKINRSGYSDDIIRSYLYGKLRRASVTIILLTPNAINHQKDWYNKYDDWMYDEIRYSLENRFGNQPKGLIAVYTPEAKPYLIEETVDSTVVKSVNNLFRVNMMNVKPAYKRYNIPNYYDNDYDCYCSLISYEKFIENIGRYIDIAIQKRNELYKYEITARL